MSLSGSSLPLRPPSLSTSWPRRSARSVYSRYHNRNSLSTSHVAGPSSTREIPSIVGPLRRSTLRISQPNHSHVARQPASELGRHQEAVFVEPGRERRGDLLILPLLTATGRRVGDMQVVDWDVFGHAGRERELRAGH